MTDRRARRLVSAAAFFALVSAGVVAHAQDESAEIAPTATPPSVREILTGTTRVRLSGFLQADWVAMNQLSQDEIDTQGQPINQDRFVLRRGRIHVDAERGIFTSSFEIDANTVNGPQMRPIDAEVSARWPVPQKPRAGELPERPDYDFLLTMALFQTPFGMETQELDTIRPPVVSGRPVAHARQFRNCSDVAKQTLGFRGMTKSRDCGYQRSPRRSW